MRENTFTHISVPASAAAKNCQTTQTEMGMATRIEAHKQPTTQSVEPTSNQNIALNENSVTDSPISGGGNTHRPSSGLNSGKHLTGLTRLASLILATLLLAACGGGGSGGGSSSGDGSNEKAPLVEARVIGSAIGGAGGGTVEVAVTATKQDNSNTTADVIFLQTVISNGASAGSASCTANLPQSDVTSQYNGTAIGSFATVTYSVNSSVAGECGAFTFSAAEDRAVGRDTLAAGAISFALDSDGDRVLDSIDVDDDGDGLIELRTAAELDMMRNNLNGTGLDADNSDMVFDAGGNSMGCGAAIGDVCNGYEQMANIDLNDLNDVYPGEANWAPTGRCTAASIVSCLPSNVQYFSAKFNGNNHTINNMRILVTELSNGIGFFGGALAGSELRNIHIRNGSINANVDIFVVGGLVGDAVGMTIISSSATMSRVSGRGDIGGLVGNAAGMTILSSYAIVDELKSSESNAGGLIGTSISGERSNIISSLVIIGDVNVALDQAGGLFGDGENATINSSYVVVSSFTGASPIGGLVGNSFGVNSIDASYVVVNNSIAGNGGLVGAERLLTGNTESSATNSYWDATTLTPSANLNLDINSIGMGLPTTSLQSGTSTSAGTNSIFSEWDQGYCNPATGEFSDSAAAGFVLAWDLGTDTEYPALNCFSTFSPAEQRETAARALAGETLVE